MIVSAPGAAHSFEHLVVSEDCVSRGALEVLATPSVVRLMELAAMGALEPELSTSEESVGAKVAVVHLQPTLAGRSVTVSATEVSRDGARRSFKVAVTEGDEVVASGDHERFVVDRERFAERLAARAAKAQQGNTCMPA